MGTNTFNNYLASIQAKLSNLKDMIMYLVTREEGLKENVQDNSDDNELAGKLEKMQNQLAELHAQISMLKAFYLDMVKC